MNKTVAVLVALNLSPAKLSQGIRLAVQQSAQRNGFSTPGSTDISSDATCVSTCSSESNISASYSCEEKKRKLESVVKIRKETNPETNEDPPPKKRAKNLTTPVANLAKKITTEFLYSRRVWSLLYPNNGSRLSNFQLGVALDQIEKKLSDPQEKHLLKTKRKEVIKRIKRVLACGKNYRKKRAEAGKVVPDSPMEHVIDLTSGSVDASAEEDEKSKDLDASASAEDMASAIRADDPGRAAISRRKLFLQQQQKVKEEAVANKQKPDKVAMVYVYACICACIVHAPTHTTHTHTLTHYTRR